MSIHHQPVFVDPKIEAQLLMSMGYRRVSLKFGGLARLDDDWAMRLAKYQESHLRGRALEKHAAELIASMGRHTEQYLRVHARDKITVAPQISQHVETASSRYGPADSTAKEKARTEFLFANQGEVLTEYGRGVIASMHAKAAEPEKAPRRAPSKD